MPPQSRRDSKNSLLAALPEAEYRRLLPHLKDVSLRKGQVLHGYDAPAQSVYFLDEGVASLSVRNEEGKGLGLSIVGNESVIGERAIFKAGVFIIKCAMLTKGSGQAMPPKAFQEEFERGGRLHDLVLNRMEARITETAQTALCNQTHTIEQRLSRWLLTLADRLHSEEFHFTQEDIADLLGVTRSATSLAATDLREAKLIEYARGSITLIDRDGLVDKSCKCYGTIGQAIKEFTNSKP